MKKEKVSVENLAVVDFRIEDGIPPPIALWKATHIVPSAESCMRQVWYGNEKDFESFPKGQGEGLEFMRGKKAYAFLLKLVCGLESKRVGETHIRHQFYGSWGNFSAQNPSQTSAYKTLFAQINADVGIIDKWLLAGHLPARPQHAACALTGQGNNDNVLIIGGVGSNGREMSRIVSDIVRLSESRQPGRKSFITLTHPENSGLDATARCLDQLVAKNIVRSGVSVAPFDTLSRLVEQNDRVYVATRMGAYPDADQEVVAAWRGRVRKDNCLAHVKGQDGVSIAPWTTAGLDRYVSPEDIGKEIARRRAINERLHAAAVEFADNCAEIRSHGEVPSQVLREIRVLQPDSDERTPPPPQKPRNPDKFSLP
jgi:hypothetical protein